VRHDGLSYKFALCKDKQLTVTCLLLKYRLQSWDMLSI